MSDVFISYSRLDIDFVCYLFDQLKARGREDWSNWQNISLLLIGCRRAIVVLKRQILSFLLLVLIQWYPRSVRWKLSMQLSITSGWLQ